MARKRSEVVAAMAAARLDGVAPAASAEERTVPLFAAPAAKPPPALRRLPVEDDFSGMHIRLRDQRGYQAGLQAIGHWTPEERHVVAMWLEGETQDVPACVQALPRTREPSEPLATGSISRIPRGEGTRVNVHPTAPPVSALEAEGSPVTVHLPQDTYSPVQYSSFGCGGYNTTVVVQEGETRAEAGRRGLAELRAIYDAEFPVARDAYLARIEDMKRRGVWR